MTGLLQIGRVYFIGRQMAVRGCAVCALLPLLHIPGALSLCALIQQMVTWLINWQANKYLISSTHFTEMLDKQNNDFGGNLQFKGKQFFAREASRAMYLFMNDTG